MTKRILSTLGVFLLLSALTLARATDESPPASASSALSGILHGIVTDSAGQPVTGLTALVTQISGTHPFTESQELTSSGEFVVNPAVGAYLIELFQGAEVVGYRTGINIFPSITTFQLMTVDLPTVCQPNLGYGEAGGMTLSLCGDDLTTAGSFATLEVYNATGNSVVYMAAGLVEAPTPFKGGTLVPVPWLVLAKLPTSSLGTVELAVPGSAGAPVSLVLQVIDPNGPSFRFSNAVLATLGV